MTRFIVVAALAAAACGGNTENTEPMSAAAPMTHEADEHAAGEARREVRPAEQPFVVDMGGHPADFEAAFAPRAQRFQHRIARRARRHACMLAFHACMHAAA